MSYNLFSLVVGSWNIGEDPFPNLINGNTHVNR